MWTEGLGALEGLPWALAIAIVGGVALTGCNESTGTEDSALPASTSSGDDDDDDDDAGDDDDADTEGADDGNTTNPGTGAPLPDFLCEDRSECVLHSDCCSCVALHVDEEAPACDDTTCMRGTCEVWGIERLLCSHTCHIELVECDASMVTCDEPAPQCEDGFLPSIDERCWSAHCVPEALCRPV